MGCGTRTAGSIRGSARGTFALVAILFMTTLALPSAADGQEEDPHELIVSAPASQAFSPNGDQYEDFVDMTWFFNAPLETSVQVFGPSGELFDARLFESGSSRRPTFTWYGRDGNRNIAPDGVYEVVLTGTDADGRRVTSSLQLAVRQYTRELGRFLSPVDGSTVSGQVEVVFEPNPAAASYPAHRMTVSSAPIHWSTASDGTIRASFDSARLPDDSYRLRIFPAGSWVDEFGYEHDQPSDVSIAIESRNGIPPIPLRVRSAPDPGVILFGDQSAAHRYAGEWILTATPARASGQVTDLNGEIVRHLDRSGAWPPDAVNLIWDGTDDSGAAVAEGQYLLTMTAEADNGSGTLTSSIDIHVVTEPVGQLPSSPAGETVSGRLDVLITPTSDTPIEGVTAISSFGSPTVQAQGDGSFLASFDTTRAKNGAAGVIISVEWLDPFGNLRRTEAQGGRFEVVVANDGPRQLWVTSRPSTGLEALPNSFNGGLGDVLDWHFSEPVDTTAWVTDEHGEVVGRLAPEFVTPELHSIEWYGFGLPEGSYTLTIQGTDASGRTATDSIDVGVSYVNRAASVVAPTNGAIVEGTINLVLEPDRRAAIEEVHINTERPIIIDEPTAGREVRVPIDTTLYNDGSRRFEVTVGWRSPQGYLHYYRIVPFTNVSINNLGLLDSPQDPTPDPEPVYTCGTVSGTASEIKALGFTLHLGGDGADFLKGTAGPDFMVGGDGNDVILAGMADDVVCAGGGHDVVAAGAGADFVDAGAGNDQIIGGNGNDHLVGNLGADDLLGGNGIDLLDGGNASDRLFGGAEADHLIGGAGRDELRGDSGDDTLEGGGADDVLRGHRGTDSCNGGPTGANGDVAYSCESTTNVP